MKGDNTRKLTAEETDYIWIRARRGVCMAALARKFEVSRQRVFQISQREAAL